VFVVGQTAQPSVYTTVALDPGTGVQLWKATFAGRSNGAYAYAITVSPDGQMVYVTGAEHTAQTGFDYTTIEYTASTGLQQWITRYNGPGNGDDTARSITTSPDGTKVYVTGQSYSGASAGYDIGTVAYDAPTGTQLWASSYNGPASSLDSGLRVLASPDGSAVFVGGNSWGATVLAMATLAYDPANGAQLWADRESGPNGSSLASIAMTPTGGLVFAAGTLTRANGRTDLDVVAYVGATGSPLWTASIAAGLRSASDVAVSPDGTKVYVSGADATSNAFLLRSYQAGTGHVLWTSLYHGPGVGGTATALGVSPDGSNVYVTGQNSQFANNTDFATVGFSSTGVRLWVTWYDGPGQSVDWPVDLAVDPTSGDVYVTGYSQGLTGGQDFATVAYQG
jgi:DNA-binding beta-propeller fold protein YncE